MTEPESHDAPVEFHAAKSPFEARLVATLLRDAGVRVFVAGEALTDEFAMSQRLMNLQGVTVMVAPEDLERARAVLAEAKEAGRLLEEGALPPDGEDGNAADSAPDPAQDPTEEDPR